MRNTKKGCRGKPFCTQGEGGDPAYRTFIFDWFRETLSVKAHSLGTSHFPSKTRRPGCREKLHQLPPIFGFLFANKAHATNHPPWEGAEEEEGCGEGAGEVRCGAVHVKVRAFRVHVNVHIPEKQEPQT